MINKLFRKLFPLCPNQNNKHSAWRVGRCVRHRANRRTGEHSGGQQPPPPANQTDQVSHNPVQSGWLKGYCPGRKCASRRYINRKPAGLVFPAKAARAQYAQYASPRLLNKMTYNL